MLQTSEEQLVMFSSQLHNGRSRGVGVSTDEDEKWSRYFKTVLETFDVISTEGIAIYVFQWCDNSFDL